MKKTLFFLLILTIPGFCFAQNDTLGVQKSKDKVIIGGQVYYVHIVKKGDSLYSLSRVYNVSQKEIARENPEIFLGLKIGQALKIPFEKDNKESIEVSDKNNFIYHRVKKQQTVYSLAKKYNVTQEDIFTCNPNARYGINEGSILKIPKSRDVVETIQKYPLEEPLKDTINVVDQFIYHEVEQGDTEFSLAVYYEITEDILKEHNPFLSDGLKIGQILKIPKVRKCTGKEWNKYYYGYTLKT